MTLDNNPDHKTDPLRTLSRWLFVLACLATVIALFYAEENWRGRRAWEKCRRELESQGARLNWDTFVPPAVPDDQNMFKAPHIQDWFIKGGSNSKTWGSPGKTLSSTGTVYLAELKIVPPGTQTDPRTTDAVLRLGDAAGLEQARKLLRQAIGPTLAGAQTYTLFARRPADITPVRIAVETDVSTTAQQLRSALATPNLIAFGASQIQVQGGGSNVFLLSLDLPRSCITAADYIAWSQKLEPDLNIIREALKRPYARMEGDYRQPLFMPIPNFVALRNVVQILGQRAQCHLLLGEPEAALKDTTFIRQMCGLLEGAPTHEPMTLVAAMIDVAVTGLYVDVVADGFRLRAWREPELKALQDQLGGINLLPVVANSFVGERAASCRTFERIKPAALNSIFSFGKPNASFWDYVTNPKSLLLPLMPRGWLFQNMRTIALLKTPIIESLDPTNFVVSPARAEESNRQVQTALGRRSPYSFIAAIAVPNMVRATQTMASRQSLVRQALLACALERYRLAEGAYPDRLDALVPKYLGALPSDILSGATLKYRRNDQGGFLLYSVGWNEQDDGGIPGKTAADGDWVWQGSEAH